MHALVERVRVFRRGPHFKRTLKFASVSVVTTVVSQTVLLLTYDVAKIPSVVACSIIATGVATVPAYWLNRTWTWGKKGKSSFRTELLPFWVIAFIGLVLSTIAVDLAAHNADIISHKKDVKDLVVHVAYLGTFALIWVGRYSIFNKYMFGANEPTEDDEPTEAVEPTGAIDTAKADVPSMPASPVEATH
jgi:putative flippase GtrA